MSADITTHYTLSDIYVVALNSWRRTLLRIALAFGIVIAALLLFFFFIDETSFSETFQSFPWAFYGWLFVILIAFAFGVAPIITYLRSKGHYLGPHRLRLQNDGVHLESPQGDSTVFWTAISRCVVSRDRLLLFIGPISALMLPRRDFADETSFEDAIKYASSRWLDAKAAAKK